MTSVLIWRGDYNTDMYRGESMGRQRRPSISQGKSPQKTSALDLRFLASRILRNKCLVFKLPSLWYFAMAALENYYYYTLWHSCLCVGRHEHCFNFLYSIWLHKWHGSEWLTSHKSLISIFQCELSQVWCLETLHISSSLFEWEKKKGCLLYLDSKRPESSQSKLSWLVEQRAKLK